MTVADKIRELDTEGMTLEQVAIAAGCSTRYACEAMTFQGLKWKGWAPPPKSVLKHIARRNEKIAHLKTLPTDRMTSREIAEAIDVSESTARKYCAALNLEYAQRPVTQSSGPGLPWHLMKHWRVRYA